MGNAIFIQTGISILAYVAEQIEEERLARTLNDKLEMIGDDKSGLYLFDRDILNVGMAASKK